MNTINKLATRKDIREQLSEQEARVFLLKVRSKFNSLKEIESEIRKIYDSSFESLSDEDLRGVLLFDEATSLSCCCHIAPQSSQYQKPTLGLKFTLFELHFGHVSVIIVQTFII